MKHIFSFLSRFVIAVARTMTCRIAVILSVVLIPCLAPAAMVVLNATDSGGYASFGFHVASNQNYGVGAEVGFPGSVNHFIVFDLSSIANTITSAQLRLYNPGVSAGNSQNGYQSPDANETFALFDVSTPIATLVAGGGGLGAVFSDLGSGTSYGGYLASSADNGSTISINLNAAALADLNAASGLFAFGGSLASLSGQTAANEGLFLFAAGAGATDRQLVLEVVPEPSRVVMALAGLVTATLVRRRSSAEIAGS